MLISRPLIHRQIRIVPIYQPKILFHRELNQCLIPQCDFKGVCLGARDISPGAEHKLLFFSFFFLIPTAQLLEQSVTPILTPWLMKPGGSMPHSQGISNNPYPEPNQPSYIVLEIVSHQNSIYGGQNSHFCISRILFQQHSSSLNLSLFFL